MRGTIGGHHRIYMFIKVYIRKWFFLKRNPFHGNDYKVTRCWLKVALNVTINYLWNATFIWFLFGKQKETFSFVSSSWDQFLRMTTLIFRRRRSNLTDTSFEFISPAADLRRLKTIEPRTQRLHQHKTRCIATADTIKQNHLSSTISWQGKP